MRIFFFFVGKVDEEGELTEKEIIRAERNSGVISNKVREIQVSCLENLAIINLHATTFSGFHLCFCVIKPI